jgi:hypothetical protein
MFEINLIRDRAILPELKKNITRYFQIGILAGVLIFVVMIGRFINISARISKEQAIKTRLDAQVEAKAKKYSVQQWGYEWINFYKNLKLINNIYTERIGWGGKLGEIVEFLPDKICIDEIVASSSEQRLAINLIALEEGQGEFDKIKQFLDKLEESKNFGQVKLESQERKVLEEKDVKLIRISVPFESATKDKKNKVKSKHHG